MTENKRRLNPFYSLKTQLCTGAIALLALTLASVSYLLIEHQKRILVGELQKTIVLQGRNIALSSRKALLRSDPEYELFPILKRISSRNDGVEYVVITDAENLIQADLELQNVSKPLELDLGDYGPVVAHMLEDEEKLLESQHSFLLKTPIAGLGKTIGFVYMRYSKQELLDSMSRAVTITVICAVATFALGIVLSLLLFRRISHPMDIMIRGVDAFGRGELETRINLPNNNEFRLLATSFNEMASKLSSAQQELVAKKIMDRELEIAHDIQRTLIPANIKQPDGYEIATYYKAAMQVGGDYVDVIPIDSTRIAFVMADVSGKGIPGLVVMAMLKIMAHDLIKKGLSPKNVIRRLNESLATNMRRNMFVTMFLAVLDTESGDLTFSNAGHNPVVIFDNTTKRCMLRRIKGRPLGL
ncbi:MAG: SpoIIE family protein phosphatase, partial [Candidatus Latescibacterota bacterium]